MNSLDDIADQFTKKQLAYKAHQTLTETNERGL